MKRFLMLLLILTLAFGFTLSAAAEKVEITYWQYFYETKKETIDQLIDMFEEENPDIEIKHETFPYENYNTKVAASVPSGTGPNIINLYYGWLPLYINSGYLRPLPHSDFAPADIEEEFFSLVSAAKIKDHYYALPTAVRSLALIYNKRLFEEAGLDPEQPPKNLDEFVEYANKLTKRDNAGNLLQSGFHTSLRGQNHHWVREVLIRQFGGQPYSDDNREVLYDSQPGYDAFEFYMDLAQKHEVGEVDFMTDDVTAFKAQRLGMTVDGSFRLGTLDKVNGLDYAVAELPSHNGVQSNFASFWANGITSFTEGEELEASIKFLKFLTSDKAMELWLENVGELPAKPSAAFTDENINDPKYGPFIKGLDYAHATYFVDEVSQRQVWIDAFDRVMLEDAAIKEAVDEAAETEQKVLDEYYEKADSK
ncbi:MAG: extracellular solute-binding protein [Bacillota bacterium]